MLCVGHQTQLDSKGFGVQSGGQPEQGAQSHTHTHTDTLYGQFGDAKLMSLDLARKLEYQEETELR